MRTEDIEMTTMPVQHTPDPAIPNGDQGKPWHERQLAIQTRIKDWIKKVIP